MKTFITSNSDPQAEKGTSLVFSSTAGTIPNDIKIILKGSDIELPGVEGKGRDIELYIDEDDSSTLLATFAGNNFYIVEEVDGPAFIGFDVDDLITRDQIIEALKKYYL